MSDRERDTKPIIRRPPRHRTASELGLESRIEERRLDKRRTSPTGVPAVRKYEPIALEVEDQREQSNRALEELLGERVVRQLRELADELTPPPVNINNIPREPSPAEAWAHASNVNVRVANLLTAIAQSSGAGMRVVPEIEKLARRVRFWRVVIVVVLVPTVSALIAIALKVYNRGFDDGLALGWRQSVDQRIERLERQRASRDGAPSLPAPWGTP